MEKFLNSGLIWIWLIPLFFGCAAPHPGREAILWVQTAAEYQAGTLQSYASAEEMLGLALADRTRTAALEQKTGYENLPPAVILDVDETVLDNSPFNARLVLENKSFAPTVWSDWVGREEARAVPGSLEFLQSASDKGIAVFFITNRECPRNVAEGECPQEASTIRNMEKLGFPAVDPSRILLKNENPAWGSEKAPRREAVAETHRILMLIGDDLGDFIPGVRKNITPEQRRNIVDQYRDRWGKQWFVLPNPVYGSWRSILADSPLDYLRGYR